MSEIQNVINQSKKKDVSGPLGVRDWCVLFVSEQTGERGCVYGIHRTQVDTHQLGNEAAGQCLANQSKVYFHNLYCDD